MGAGRRLRQGLNALLAFSRPVDQALAERHLSPELQQCFGRLRRSEQLHSLRVLRALQAEDSPGPDLAVAALLHDLGKTRWPFPLWQRVLVVVLPRLAPALARRLARGSEADPLVRPFLLHEQHPAWGARMARAAGASERAAWLIENHEGKAVDDEELARLRAADERN
ncbi:MAG: HD domain-containing protein [Anaerolineaceae bacterium]|nr:HD domain-containing protein [Anaerolineaceae bacterium]